MIGDAELARRLERFQADVCAEFGQDVLRVGNGTAVFAGVGSPVTQAIGVDSVPPVDIRLAEDLKVWTRIAAEAFATPEMSVEFLEGVMEPFARAKNAGCYLAYVDSEPAGSGSMFISRDALHEDQPSFAVQYLT